MDYLFMGDSLGGLGVNHNFDETIDKVVKLSGDKNLVLMCVEKDPKKCHRYEVLTPEIEQQSLLIFHILWDF